MIEVDQNFDWKMTNKKMCIFMPSYHDKKYTEFSLKNLSCSLPKSDYIIIVGFDYEDSLPGLEDNNIYYFSIKRNRDQIRNGAFIRNYCLKRCQSELFFSKDGEVVVLGDFVKACVEQGGVWRAGNIHVTSESQALNYISKERLPPHTYSILQEFPDTAYSVKDIIYNAKGGVNCSSYFHYAFCERTSILQNINGYDEDFYYYGYEDSDMFCRLYSLDRRLIPDYSCSAVHLWHPQGNMDFDTVVKMEEIFLSKDPYNTVRNENGWGEG